MILLPTPARIPYGLRPVTSSEEYAKESIELEEGVSEGICNGRNVYLGGSAGGGESERGASGELDNVIGFPGSVLIISFVHQ
jgi:hypothetical protein